MTTQQLQVTNATSSGVQPDNSAGADEQRDTVPAHDEQSAAIAEVEEQMTVLATNIRSSMRDAAAGVHPALQPFGLKLLRLLARCGPTHASVVADALFVDRSAVSRQVRQLEELGLLELQVDPEDGRARFLTLSELATRKLAKMQHGDEVLIRKRLRTWSPADLHTFAQLIARLNDSDDSSA